MKENKNIKSRFTDNPYPVGSLKWKWQEDSNHATYTCSDGVKRTFAEIQEMESKGIEVKIISMSF